MTGQTQFSHLGKPRHIWTISAINGDVNRLRHLHHVIENEFQLGDRIVYTGNYLGTDTHADPIAVIDELLRFRRMILRPGMLCEDIAYLRGSQEEIWEKLLQLHFAPNPQAVLEWMQDKGAVPALRAYGSSFEAGIHAMTGGVVSTARWTSQLRDQIRQHAGHELFFLQLKRAALTEATAEQAPLLFVHAGIDPKKALSDQGDSFWWRAKNFNKISSPFENFKYVIRGCDPEQNGMYINGVTMSLDDGCGHGGALTCAEMTQNGDVTALYQA